MSLLLSWLSACTLVGGPPAVSEAELRAELALAAEAVDAGFVASVCDATLPDGATVSAEVVDVSASNDGGQGTIRVTLRADGAAREVVAPVEVARLSASTFRTRVDWEVVCGGIG